MVCGFAHRRRCRFRISRSEKCVRSRIVYGTYPVGTEIQYPSSKSLPGGSANSPIPETACENSPRRTRSVGMDAPSDIYGARRIYTMQAAPIRTAAPPRQDGCDGEVGPGGGAGALLRPWRNLDFAVLQGWSVCAAWPRIASALVQLSLVEIGCRMESLCWCSL